MTLSSESPKILNRALLALGAGACLALSFPPYSFPLLLPFGVALLLLSLRGGTLRQRLFCGLLCGSLYFGGTLFWLANLFGLAAVSLCAILTSFIIIFAGAFGGLEKRLQGWKLGVGVVLLWVVVEWFRSEPFVLHFGWMGLGYGVVNSVLLAQMASVVGCYGVSALAAPNGQEVRRIGGTQAGFMDVEVGRTERKTLYVLGGWLFPHGCLLGLFFLVGRTLYLEKRR